MSVSQHCQFIRPGRALEKTHIFQLKSNDFSYFSTKTYVVSTHNVCFRGEIRKTFI